MATSIIQRGPVIFSEARVDNIIYALRSHWLENPFTGSGIPSFGNGHQTFHLLWYEHKGYADGSDLWNGPQQDNKDWVFDQIMPDSCGRIYAVERDGDLLWYNHRGRANGTSRWVGPRDIGDGWRVRTINPGPRDFLGVFCNTRIGENHLIASKAASVIYAVRLDGTLEWYRHDGASNGKISWANGGLPITVGTGWVDGHQRVFSGCNGIIYLIGDDGTLRWYKHRGYLDGTFDWEGPNEVGVGWNNFHNVFSIGRGIIYAIDKDGTLWWYKHKGYQTGTPEWEDRKKVGYGWNADGFRVVCNSIYLNPTFI